MKSNNTCLSAPTSSSNISLKIVNMLYPSLKLNVNTHLLISLVSIVIDLKCDELLVGVGDAAFGDALTVDELLAVHGHVVFNSNMVCWSDWKVQILEKILTEAQYQQF